MKALIWKDYRVNRQILIVGFCLLVAPYLAAIGWQWYDVGLSSATAPMWGQSLSVAASSSLNLSQLTILLLAGHIIAGERRDRSAEFLAYLPPSRAVILTSKAILAAITLLVIWGTYLIAAEVLIPAIHQASSDAHYQSSSGTLEFQIVICVALFGTAWFGSSMLESPTFSTAIGIFAAILVPVAINLVSATTGVPGHGEPFIRVLKITLLVMGILGFAAGWWYYVRRVEP